MLVCCIYHSSVPSYLGFLILVLVGSYLINTLTNKKPLFKGGDISKIIIKKLF
jgi:hypothetical protein